MFRRLLSTVAVPVAPLCAAALAYTIYHPPRRRQHRSPEEWLNAEQIRVPIGGGRKHLDAWLCRGAADRVVVVGHGIGLSKSASLRHAEFLYQAGYTVCLFDHRNHGESSPDRAFWGLAARFTADVIAVVDHLRAMPEFADAWFALYGFSFSTFPVSYVPTRGGCRVDAIICDSGPALEIEPLFRDFVRTDALPVPRALRAGPSAPVLARTFAALGTAMLQAPWPPRAEPYADIPMLFLTGAEDSVVPAAGVAAFAELFPGSQLQVFPGTEHLAGLKARGSEYVEVVTTFLDRASRAARAPDADR